MFRALKDRDVETELIVYPREGHGIREREHVRDLLERVVDWYVERV
jgi:dipeptidyl aminopeptidase/acylaminoacyl peptidase